MKMRIVQITATLYFELPEGQDPDGYGYDAANELLREHQRDYSPISDFLDYSLDSSPVASRLDTAKTARYEEGDYSFAIEETT